MITSIYILGKDLGWGRRKGGGERGGKTRSYINQRIPTHRDNTSITLLLM